MKPRTLLTFLAITAAFVTGITVGKAPAKKQTNNETVGNVQGVVSFSAKESKKPNVKFFVMSFCPFGNQAETGLKPVFDLLGDKVEWEPRYIIDKSDKDQIIQICKSRVYDEKQCQQYIDQGYFPNLDACKQRFYKTEAECFEKTTSDCLATEGNNYYCSLHGKKELNQDVREVCAWNLTNDKSKWWQFISLVNKNCQLETIDACWQNQAKDAQLDTDKIQECFNKDAIALLDKEIESSQKFNVQGSPTVFVNDVSFPPEGAYDQEGKAQMKILGENTFSQAEYRSPEAFKQAVCASFEKAPKECKTELLKINDVGSEGSCN